jgi:GTP-binding protein EngB required for normal cell division
MHIPSQYLGSARTASECAKITSLFPRMVFVGRSNSGKSSLINSLLKAPLANVSKMPGKTRFMHLFQKGKVLIVDVPGYGYAKGAKTELQQMSEIVSEAVWGNPKEEDNERNNKTGIKMMIEKDKEDKTLNNLLFSRVFLLIDARRGTPLSSDLQMIHALKKTKTIFDFVITKSDRVSITESNKIATELAEEYDAHWIDQVPVVQQTISNPSLATSPIHTSSKPIVHKSKSPQPLLSLDDFTKPYIFVTSSRDNNIGIQPLWQHMVQFSQLSQNYLSNNSHLFNRPLSTSTHTLH